MHEVAVIFRRELKSYFLSPIAYVFGALFLGVQLFFSAKNVLAQGQQASMQPFFEGILPWVFLGFVPGLTMRLWAEERRSGTLELLMTFPVRIGQLVSGKFLAAVAFIGLMLAFTLGLPLTMTVFGKLDWGPVLGSYTGSLLLAAAFLASGMFWSSMTRDQMVARLAALVTLLGLRLLGAPIFLEDVASNWPTALLDLINGISPYKYFESIARGVIDTRDIVYFACFCGFFLYANALVLHARRRKG